MKKAFPFIRLLPVLLFGWWWGSLDRLLHPALLLLTGIACLILMVLAYHPRGWLAYRERWIYGALASVFLFSAGYQLGASRVKALRSPFHFSHDEQATAWLLHFSEAPRITASGKRLIAEVMAVEHAGGLLRAEGRVVVYAPDSLPVRLNDRFWVYDRPRKLNSLPFPGTFDFTAWLADHGIHHELRISANKLVAVDPDPDPSLALRFSLYRERLLNIFREAGLRDEAWAVMSALVLGYDDAVDAEVMQAFSATGTLHVLSVSGLHVGLVYAAIRMLLGFLNRRTFGKRLQQVLSLLFIWLYAFLTGASPAVLRSAAMLSLVLGSNLVNRPAAVWNSLAASIFLLTVADPSLPADVGFQLSYAAVGGILALYPWLRERSPVRTKLGQRVWEFMSVSVAAQWFTFPLGLYYFHQFPNLFLLTNAIIIPLSTLAMFAGLVLLFLGPIAGLGPLLGSLLQHFMDAFLALVEWMGDLPCAQTTGIWINVTQLTALSLLVLCIHRWVISGNGRLLLAGLFSVMICLGVQVNVRQQQLSEADISVLPVRASVCLLKTGSKAFLLVDTVDLSPGIRSRIDAHLNFRGIDPKVCQTYLLKNSISLRESGGMFLKEGDCLVIGKDVYWLTDGSTPIGRNGTIILRKAGRPLRVVSNSREQEIIADGSLRRLPVNRISNVFPVSERGYWSKSLIDQTH